MLSLTCYPCYVPVLRILLSDRRLALVILFRSFLSLNSSLPVLHIPSRTQKLDRKRHKITLPPPSQALLAKVRLGIALVVESRLVLLNIQHKFLHELAQISELKLRQNTGTVSQ